jgi:hypothetical protein
MIEILIYLWRDGSEGSNIGGSAGYFPLGRFLRRGAIIINLIEI